MIRELGWEKSVKRLERLMRLKSFPVAFTLFENKNEMNEIPFLRRVNHKSTLCQLLNLARNSDWTVGAELKDFTSVMCPSIIGLTDIPQFMKDGTFRSLVWTKNRADGKIYENSIPRVPIGKYEAVAVAPLVYNPFDPDIILIYANPAQMMLLINSLQFEDYEVMQFFCVGESSCSDAIARCINTGKPSLTIPCFGERRYGHAQDDELVMALPPNLLDKTLKGMKSLYNRGIRYPISPAGAETDLIRQFPTAYSEQERIEKIKGNDNRLLLGITGGVASGKSTVALMLEELGAPIIDFDILSRIVVEPNKPAWEDIVGFFGKQVLNEEDSTIDRKRLREIVFQDMEKRKKLENFIHPRLLTEFHKQIEQIADKTPGAIIQVIIPLLIETSLQAMFDHLLMVYVPEEEQIERIVNRDRTTRNHAIKIIQTQLSVEDKKGYCDLLIDNSGSVEESRTQAKVIWKKLKKIQEERKNK